MTARRKPAAFEVGRVHVRARRGPDKDGRWYMQARVFEDRAERTVWRGWATRAEAEPLIAGMVARGEIAIAAPVDETEKLHTIRDLLEAWVGSLQARRAVDDLSAHGLSAYKNSAERVLGRLAEVRIDALTATTIEGYRLARLVKGAPATVRQDLKALRSAWRWAREHGHGVDRDFPSVRKFGKLEPVRNHRTPEESEADRMLEQLAGWRRLACQIMRYTGARVGEVAALTWGDVDLTGGTVQLDGKSGRRRIPIRPELIAALRGWPRGFANARVLSVSAGVVTGRLVEYMATACRVAGVPVFTPHGLRRLQVNYLRRSGVSVEVAAALMGHSVVVMLAYYREVSMDDMRAAVAMRPPVQPSAPAGSATVITAPREQARPRPS